MFAQVVAYTAPSAQSDTVEQAAATHEDQKQRATNYLKRSLSSDSFRPKKVHRASVEKALVMSDNQVLD